MKTKANFNEPPSTSDIKNFLGALAACKAKPAFLSVHPDYCERFIPKCISKDYPRLMSELFDETASKLSKDELGPMCPIQPC